MMQEKVLSALSEAGLFTSGGLVRDKVSFGIRPHGHKYIIIFVLDTANRCLKYNLFLICTGSLL
jgi:hypothetical protein